MRTEHFPILDLSFQSFGSSDSSRDRQIKSIAYRYLSVEVQYCPLIMRLPINIANIEFLTVLFKESLTSVLAILE
jgi:hypothetical protein